jgi:hypothetical protein
MKREGEESEREKEERRKEGAFTPFLLHFLFLFTKIEKKKKKK